MFSLNTASLASVLSPGSTQAVVYGYQDCLYEDLFEEFEYLISEEHPLIQKVFDYKIGVNPPSKVKKITTLEGRRMSQIKYETNSIC